MLIKKLGGKYVNIPHTYIYIILTFIFISRLKIPNKSKTVIILTIIVIYHRNLVFLIKTLNLLVTQYQHLPPVKYRYTDIVLRRDVTDLFNSVFNFKHNFDNLPKKPTILVCNYVKDRLENFACIMIPKNFAIMVGGVLAKYKMFGLIKHLITKEKKNGSFTDIEKQVKEKTSQGLSIFSYITSDYIDKKTKYVPRIRKGIFHIASNLNLTVTPVYIDSIDTYCGIILKKKFKIVIGDTMDITDVPQAIYKTRMFYRDQIK
jgi:hypothetical protein